MNPVSARTDGENDRRILENLVIGKHFLSILKRCRDHFIFCVLRGFRKCCLASKPNCIQGLFDLVELMAFKLGHHRALCITAAARTLRGRIANLLKDTGRLPHKIQQDTAYNHCRNHREHCLKALCLWIVVILILTEVFRVLIIVIHISALSHILPVDDLLLIIFLIVIISFVCPALAGLSRCIGLWLFLLAGCSLLLLSLWLLLICLFIFRLFRLRFLRFLLRLSRTCTVWGCFCRFLTIGF